MTLTISKYPENLPRDSALSLLSMHSDSQWFKIWKLGKNVPRTQERASERACEFKSAAERASKASSAEQANEWAFRLASERASEWASCPLQTSRFQEALNHCAMVKILWLKAVKMILKITIETFFEISRYLDETNGHRKRVVLSTTVVVIDNRWR